MNFLLSLVLIVNFNFNSTTYTTSPPPLIDAYILAYDAMYTGGTEPRKDFIILDMESIYFVDTSYQERQKVITHFSKYNKQVLSASLFKLKEIGLVNKHGNLIIDGDLLMMTNVYSSGDGSLIIEGTKYHGPIAAYIYRVVLKHDNGSWEIEKLEHLGIA